MLTGSSNLLKFIISGDSSQLQQEMQKAERTVTGFADSAASGAGRMRTVTGQIDGLTMSTKQLNAATRGLPAQFTDIFVSLQGGQAPLTVLLQQGGQLKDMFGGIGPAAKAMGGYIMGLVNPYSLAAAGVIALGVAYYQGSAEQDKWQKTLVTTGNAMGVTTSELRGYAQQLDGVVGTQHAAAAGLNDMLAAGVAGGSQLRDYTQAAMAWESATGRAVSDTAKQFKDLAGEPLKAVVKLNEGTNFLTVDLYGQIKALDEQGRTTEAARLAQDAYAQTLNERSVQIKDNLGYLESAWMGIKSAAAQAWDAMLNVGRKATLEDQLTEVEKQLDIALANQSWGETAGGAATGRVNNAYLKQVQENIQALSAQKWALMEKIDAERMGAVVSAENAKAVAAQEGWRKVTEANLSKEVKLTRELIAVRNAGVAAGIAEQDIEIQLAAVREKYAEKTKKASTVTETAYKSLISAITEKRAAVDKELSQGEKLTEYEKLRLRYQQDLVTRGREYSVAQRAKIEADLAALEVSEKQAIAERELVKAWEEDAKALEAYTKKQEAQIASVISSVEKLRLEEEAHALAEAANISHAEAVERLTIARLEEAQVQMLAGAGSQEEIERINREIEARKQLLGLLGQKSVREANAKAAKDAAKEWEKAGETISRTLEDYIMAGGKSGADYVERLFRNLVLQPVVQYGGNSLMGALGMGPQGNAVNSVLGGNNVGTTVLNNAGAIGAGFQAMYGMSVGASSASLLGANAVGMVGGDALGALAAANGMWAGVATGAQAAAQSAIAANVAMEAGTAAALEAGALAAAQGAATGAAAGASSIMSGIATAAPWIAGALALYSIAKSFDDSGTLHYGAGAVYSGGKLQTGADIYNRDTFGMGSRGEWNANAQQNASGIAASLGAALDGFAIGFGQKAGYTVATAFADDSSDDGAWGSLRIADALGNVLVDWENSRSSKWAPKELASGDEGYKQFLDQIAVDAKAPFLAMDIPAWSKSMIQAATDIDSLSAALAQVGTVKTVLDSLGKSLSMFADLSGEAQTTLLNSSGSIDALAQNASAFYQGFYSEQERYENSLKQMQEVLAGFGVSIDPAMGDRAKAEFRAAVSAAFDAGQFELGAQLLGINQQFLTLADYAQKAGVAVDGVAEILSDVMLGLLDERKSLEAELLRAQGDQSGYLAAVRAIATAGYAEAEIAAWDYNTALQAQIDALSSAKGAALAFAQANLNSAQTQANHAMRQLEASVNREKSYWQSITSASQTAVSSLSSTLQLLTSNAKALYGTVDSTQQMLAAQGMDYVESALKAVRGGGDIKGFSGLEDAISAARAGISSDGYATQFERERDTLVLAGQLSELGDLTDVQLSVQERQLKAAQSQIEQLDQTLEYWRESFNYDQLQIDATLSIGGAISVLAASISAQKAAQAAAQSAQWNNSIVSATPAGEWDKAALYSQMASSGMSDSQIREQVGKATGNYQADSDWDYLKKLAGVPGFASGGLHSGGLRLVGERGPELEVTGPARYWDAGKTMQMLQGSGSGGNTERLERLVEGLTAEVQRLQLLVNEGNRYAGQTADILDRVTEGGNGMRADVINTSLRVETA